MSELNISFEIFPPHLVDADDALVRDAGILQGYDPAFISVTYGAGGSKRDRSERIVDKLLDRNHPNLAAHLTAAGHSRESVCELLSGWWDKGLRHIVAIRGDAAGDDDIACAAELTEIIRDVADFEVSVSAYPERHPKSVSWDAELDHLKRKFEAGATRAITQYFFDPDLFLRYRDRVAAAGITAPIVPGILPVRSIEQVKRFSKACGASVPQWLEDRFTGLDQCPDAVTPVAVATIVELVSNLRREGVEDFHLYTLNRVPEAVAVCHSLGITPNRKEAA
ncbi:methylenetetrahydrofolate reductase [Aestuariispira insulae]|uniref:Methylenetetrahydrofolate reductase n=1 Tax=Aestuariispira insulae TaxID=1461337 RepID=A0A3D9HRY9_9PROT|nr:methylenetetrahydrofolate reductase [Aestuariispira insulae]RED52268.1 5,10-methylenetetrahydrofolate reductase (NAD(P)) [Aestuariispira insulae]